VEENLKTLVISAFPGTGKTCYAENNDGVLDAESSNFSWIQEGVRHPDFPQNYIEHIKAFMGETDIIFVSSHEVVREALIENEIDFILVFPERSLKEQYVQRFKRRGNNKQFIDMISDNWDKFIDEMDNQRTHPIIKLKTGEFISNYKDTLIAQLHG
jgi:hypothetical protein